MFCDWFQWSDVLDANFDTKSRYYINQILIVVTRCCVRVYTICIRYVYCRTRTYAYIAYKKTRIKASDVLAPIESLLCFTRKHSDMFSSLICKLAYMKALLRSQPTINLAYKKENRKFAISFTINKQWEYGFSHEFFRTCSFKLLDRLHAALHLSQVYGFCPSMFSHVLR